LYYKLIVLHLYNINQILIMEQIIKWSQSNPGALSFLMQLTTHENAIQVITILQKLEQYESILGTNLYVLWSDLCDKDINIVEHVINKCPQNVLEDACSRQDYSGIKLIQKYI